MYLHTFLSLIHIYARQGEYKYGEFVIGYSYNVAETAEHGETQLQKEHPLDEKLLQEIEKTDGVKNMHTVQRLEVSWEAHDTQEEGDEMCIRDRYGITPSVGRRIP